MPKSSKNVISLDEDIYINVKRKFIDSLDYLEAANFNRIEKNSEKVGTIVEYFEFTDTDGKKRSYHIGTIIDDFKLPKNKSYADYVKDTLYRKSGERGRKKSLKEDVVKVYTAKFNSEMHPTTGEGHLTGLRFATYVNRSISRPNLLEATFDGDTCVYFGVSDFIWGLLANAAYSNTLVQSHAKRAYKKKNGDILVHRVGVLFWELVRILGTQHGVRYDFIYDSINGTIKDKIEDDGSIDGTDDSFISMSTSRESARKSNYLSEDDAKVKLQELGDRWFEINKDLVSNLDRRYWNKEKNSDRYRTIARFLQDYKDQELNEKIYSIIRSVRRDKTGETPNG